MTATTKLMPVYELQLENVDPELPSTVHTVNLLVGEPLHFRCKMESDQEHEIMWIYNGNPVNSTHTDKNITTERHSTSLKIDNFKAEQRGQYECAAKYKNGEKRIAKLRVDTKEVAYVNMFNEEICDSRYSGYCKNGGTCLVHKPTSTLSCRCSRQFVGPKCEYAENFVDKITKAEQSTSLITAGAVMGTVLILASMAFIFFIKYRHRVAKFSTKRNKSYDAAQTLMQGLSSKNGQMITSPANEGTQTISLVPKVHASAHGLAMMPAIRGILQESQKKCNSEPDFKTNDKLYPENAFHFNDSVVNAPKLTRSHECKEFPKFEGN